MTEALPLGQPLAYRRTTCRLCGSTRLSTVVSLTPTPPANGLTTAAQRSMPLPSFPLEVRRCPDCQHLQLADVVEPRLLFQHYLYVSGTSPVMVGHLEEQARAIIRRLSLQAGDLVVEIGSNDGTLLRFFRDAGVKVIGVDPARNLAERANAAGIPTIPEFFTPSLAERIVAEHGPATAVCANHCLAHIDDLSSVIDGVRRLLKPRGELIFEVGYLLDVIQKTLFDTIYHEHLDYHHVAPLVGFFRRHGMTLVRVERQDIQGGSLRGYVRLGVLPEEPSVAALLSTERDAALDCEDTYRSFRTRIDQRSEELGALLHGLRERGRHVAGYGAPAKATTLLYQFGLDGAMIDYIVDDNPLKRGLFTPGRNIPIEPVSRLYERRPDYTIILAWNFVDSIIMRQQRYAAEGGRFIVPLPDLCIR
jgi:SAM-dependent methyltransferase